MLYIFSIESLCKDTGFQIEVPFEEGILKTVNWIKDNEKRNET